MGNNKESYFHNAPVSASGLGAHLISSNRLVSIGSPLWLRSPAGSPISRLCLGRGGREARCGDFSYRPAFLALFVFIYTPAFFSASPSSCPLSHPVYLCNPHKSRVVGKPLLCKSKLKQKPCYCGGSSVFLFSREIIQINQAVFVYGQITTCIRNF